MGGVFQQQVCVGVVLVAPAGGVLACEASLWAEVAGGDGDEVVGVTLLDVVASGESRQAYVGCRRDGDAFEVQVDGRQIVGQPAVSGAKALGLGGLGVPRDGEAAGGRFERSWFGDNQAWRFFGTR